MSVTINGIRNCDTMKKAVAWLEQNGVDHTFRDYKKQPPTQAELESWSQAAGWEKVINKAGMTFRKLPDADKQDLDQPRAIALMLDKPSMIKRPVLEHDGGIEIGFKPEGYAAIFGK
ncbi:arsenate reductase [Tepidamorphus sp. 3E244]|uniref:arsenate reductase n=1 Tax=Tepidamorphus sp. 3E244 TaxID=3385498 RepID=UPI0038FCE8B6